MQNEEELKNTLKNLQVSVIEDTIQLLTNAPLIYLFARGLSETIAEEMELKLQLLNKQVAYFHDPNIIKKIQTTQCSSLYHIKRPNAGISRCGPDFE